MDRGARSATVHGVTKNWTRLKRLSTDARRGSKEPAQSHTIFPLDVHSRYFSFSCGFMNQINLTEPTSLILALGRRNKLCHCGITGGRRKKNENGFPPKANQCALSHPVENTWKMLPFFVGKVVGSWIYCFFYHSVELQQVLHFFWLHFLMEKAMAAHSSTLAWKIPWTEEPGRLQSMRSQRVGHDWSDLAAAALSHLWV